MLKVGDKAPGFSLASDSGKEVTLKDFAGKTLVVYFYPRDSTPGCTREAIAFTALREKLLAEGAFVVGISTDSVKSHVSFRDKHDLKIPLLADPEKKVHAAFGAFGEKNMYGKKVMGTIRSTFVIGPDGKVAHVWPNVKVDGHAEAVLAAISGHSSSGGKAVATKAPKSAAKKAPAAKKPAAKKAALPKKAAAKKPVAKSAAKKK